MTDQAREPYWGKLIPEITAWCGECGHWDSEESPMKTATAQFKENGWRKHKKLGWICPDCSREHFDELSS